MHLNTPGSAQSCWPCRKTLVNVLLLVDGSVPTQNVDLGCAEWLAQHEVPFTLVFTKTDKRKKKCPSPTENIQSFEVGNLASKCSSCCKRLV